MKLLSSFKKIKNKNKHQILEHMSDEVPSALDLVKPFPEEWKSVSELGDLKQKGKKEYTHIFFFLLTILLAEISPTCPIAGRSEAVRAWPSKELTVQKFIFSQEEKKYYKFIQS